MDRLKILAPLYPYLCRYRTRLILGSFCVVLSNAAAILSPLVLKYAVDSLKQAISRDRLLGYGLLVVLFAVLEGVFLFLMRKILIGVSRYMEYDMRNDLFAHLLGLSRRYYQEHKTGDIMSRSTNDLNAVRMLLGPGIMYSANTIVRMIVVLFLMLRISLVLTIFALVTIPTVSLAVRYFGALIHRRFEKIQQAFSEISAKVQENLSGVRVIRAFTQESSEIEQFKRLNEDYIVKSLQLIRIWGTFYPLLGALLGVGGVFVLWLGGRQVMAGEITLGDFVAFNAYLGMLTWPMIALGWVINIMERGTASMGRINQILESPAEIIDESVKVTPGLLSVNPRAVPTPRQSAGKYRPQSSDSSPEIQGAIEFDHVFYAYNGRLVLRDIQLKIPQGATFAIVGETGSGKSTLVNLLGRLHDLREGEIRIDGIPIKQYPLGTLRRSIGYVPQETFLFSQSMRENIAFGIDNGTEEEITEAARLAHILPDIEEFPRGFETLIGERGITLSGGQQQRTAIARALIRNPGILVLDDALSSVDTYTEEKILTALESIMHGRTSILISHRVSTVKFADQIVVLKDGQIAERGTHDQLLGLSGYYAELYQKQLLEEELAES
ncbi:MAG TPA: ABC transporter ATP-binding protein [Terriglobia bacterium]|nr:ABC transporter ATP-binding protein [Terriglobia bacterium]